MDCKSLQVVYSESICFFNSQWNVQLVWESCNILIFLDGFYIQLCLYSQFGTTYGARASHSLLYMLYFSYFLGSISFYMVNRTSAISKCWGNMVLEFRDCIQTNLSTWFTFSIQFKKTVMMEQWRTTKTKLFTGLLISLLKASNLHLTLFQVKKLQTLRNYQLKRFTIIWDFLLGKKRNTTPISSSLYQSYSFMEYSLMADFTMDILLSSLLKAI